MSEDIKILDDALVADYLRRHPDFFVQQTEVLAELRIPHASGSTVSLVERQMSLLRERSNALQQRMQRLVEVARDNDRLFELTRQLTLDLLAANSLESLVATLDDGLRERFRVPVCGLLLVSDYQLDVVRSVPLTRVRQQMPLLMHEQMVCGTLRPRELEFLFGVAAGEVRSAAVAGFGDPLLQGVLALGSPDPQRYSHSVGTLFLGFVAQVLARILPPLLQAHCRGSDQP